MLDPVMKPLSSLMRKAMALATSSDSPTRPTRCRSLRASRTSSRLCWSAGLREARSTIILRVMLRLCSLATLKRSARVVDVDVGGYGSGPHRVATYALRSMMLLLGLKYCYYSVCTVVSPHLGSFLQRYHLGQHVDGRLAHAVGTHRRKRLDA